MDALVIAPGKPGARLAQRPEGKISDDHELKLRVLAVGICGTDREEAAGGRALAPPGQADLVLGHEMLGQVIETGSAVQRVHRGDLAVLTVRRGCGHCLPCQMNRSDMCRTGQYQERGIWGLDGYQCGEVIDQEQYVVRVPKQLGITGVLCEPLSIVEKAIDESVRVQSIRLPGAPATPAWLFGRPCLVAGLGPVGLLAAMALRLRGAEVTGLDVVDADTPRPQWLIKIGGHYVDGRSVPAEKLDRCGGPFDFVFEAAGVPSLAFDLMDVMQYNGIYALTGIPGGDREIRVPGAELLRMMVLKNLLVMGSVNAARDHFQMGVDDLLHARLLWGEHIDRLVTQRYPYTAFEEALKPHAGEEIKAVVEWHHQE